MLVELSVAISVGEFAGVLISHSLATDSSLFSMLMLTSLEELSETNHKKNYTTGNKITQTKISYCNTYLFIDLIWFRYNLVFVKAS